MTIARIDTGLVLAGVSLRVALTGDYPPERVGARLGAYAAPLPAEASPIEVGVTIDPAWRSPRTPLARYPAPEVTILPDGRLHFLRLTDELTYDPGARVAQGMARPNLSRDPDGDPTPLDTPLRLVLAYELPRRDGLLMHASGYADARGAVLFVAVSGGGKTTTARKLPHETVLSDDQVAVRRTAAGWEAHALPFVGEYRRATRPQVAPLRAVVLLGKGPEVALTPVPAPAALARLMGCVVYFVRGDPAARALLDLAVSLVSSVPVLSLVTTREAPMEPVLDRLLG